MIRAETGISAQIRDSVDPTSQALFGKWALVTGAGSGIGRAVAVALAARGASLIAAGRTPRTVDETVAAIRAGGGRAMSHILDVTDDGAVADLGQFVDANCERGLAVLVHCAARSIVGSFEETSVEDLDSVLDTNIRAPFLITRRLSPALRRARGDVVFVNSLASVRPRAEVAAYAASKAALRAFAEALRDELNPHGVRVLSVFPGRAATPMQEEVHRHEGRDYRPELLITPESVARLTVEAVTLDRSAELTELFVRPAKQL